MGLNGIEQRSILHNNLYKKNFESGKGVAGSVALTDLTQTIFCVSRSCVKRLSPSPTELLSLFAAVRPCPCLPHPLVASALFH